MNKNSLKTNIPTFNNNKLSQNKLSYDKIKIISISIGILFLLSIITYLIICLVYYYKTDCYKKKSIYNYLFDYENNSVCIQENAPIPPKKESLLTMIENKLDRKEVFHIANQDYTYEQSKCKCESYGSRLATKSEIIDAYNNGANWCTYGWTENQSAYYPVQQCEWDKINTENERLPKKSKKYCGIPGVNGGYFSNPLLKFGINCFGVKPKGHISKQKKPYCPPMNFCKLPTNFNASHKLPDDEIVGFNNDKWNE